ncbi:class A beta-lactamase [Mycolicibacterium parafortuitum]|uniref:Beta-lactamase n=1 Tax=Mycolicibacterium parafortuitum TaxID=39692 RepID=A0A375YJZ1_MYCPF|nr:class A beta-lactamase [Mycolicibacterium parafortuitum]ORB27978.1 class A beta-lactamase [Mycolicibacterium parafortuitum]SRX81431.1 beta-lactamase, penicillin binding protein [Rhodococcus jostii RHA1] [Mycolicibacterium parafortuitum]
MTELTRRHVLLGGLSLFALTACSTQTVLAEPAGPLPPAQDRIAALGQRHNAQIGLYAANLDTGDSLAFGDTERFAMCSTFKAYAAGAVLQRVQQGALRLGDTVPIRAEDIRPHSPVTEPWVGTEMTLAELCQAALQQSDNAAANALLGVLGGPPAITEFARGIGDDQTRLDRWEVELNSAVPGDPRDTSTPRALGTGYRALLTGDVLEPAGRQQLTDWMLANQTSSMRAGLPQGFTSADKTGSGDYGTTNDVGVVFGPDGQRLVVAVMTRSITDDPDAPSLRPLIGELATLVLAELDGPSTGAR